MLGEEAANGNAVARGSAKVESFKFAPQISLFGTIYDEKGVHSDPKKVEDIKMLPTQESKTTRVLGDCHAHGFLCSKPEDHKSVSAVTCHKNSHGQSCYTELIL